MQAARRALFVQLSGMRGKATAASPGTRDGPEVSILRAWLMFGTGIAAYTVSQELVSPRAGSFFDVNLRGDVNRQMDAAVDAAVKEGRLDAAATDKGSVKHTWWWRLGHVKKGGDQDKAAATAMAEARVKAPVLTRMA